MAFLGFSTYSWTNPMGDDAAVRARVQSAVGQADIVVVFLHAGAEGADKQHVPRGPESAFGEYRGNSRHFARVAIDAGADLVLGSGPHVLRGLELYKNRLVAYSLGNLAGWHNFGTGGRSSLSALITVAVGPAGRFYLARITSYTLDGAGVPHADRGRGAVKLMRSLAGPTSRRAISRSTAPGSSPLWNAESHGHRRHHVISLGRADASASEYIAAIQRRLADQDRVRYVMHAMGTSLEGSTADILALVGELHACRSSSASRASTPSSSSTSAVTRSRRSRTRLPQCSVCSSLGHVDAAPSHHRHDPLNGFRADAPGARFPPRVLSFL